jgi:CPA2 family monovalent cation:H+ antiporter-2
LDALDHAERSPVSELVAFGLLGLGVALGLFINKKARVFGIPALMGFGLVLGKKGLGFFEEGPALDGALHVGLVLMLFFTSLFGNPRALRDGGRVGLPLAAYDLVLNFGVAWWVGALMGWSTEDRLFLAGIIATTSTAVVMKLLGDEGRITRREGNVLVSMLMVEDWVFLAFYAFLGIQYGDTFDLSATSLAIALPLFAGFLLLVRALRPFIWSLGQREVLIALLTAIGLVGAFLGGRAGLPEVGSAFTTGLVLSGPQGGRLQREAPHMREVAAGVFFIAFGAQLGPGLGVGLLPLLGLCLGGVIVVEMLFIPVLARRLGLRRSEAFLVGSSLVARGGKSAAFARLYPNRDGNVPLFPIAGLLAVVLTPLAPLLVKFALLFARPHPRLNYGDPGESFSRGARGLLLPHPFQQKPSIGIWNRVVFGEWLTLTMCLAALGVLAP